MTEESIRLELLRMEVDLAKSAIEAGPRMEYYAKDALTVAMKDVRAELDSATNEGE